ncbi:MAG TPA: DNA repair protein RecO C-terminal domain-containing protein [Spirochaetales bacterium]|nr:DNA repair protein RecO C-terminal domain-containing protein [Spirochaetales bacterium]HRY53040.1 DNA repair protein RecO C-terminal domain-containing protein [Spirochaetia bacterium]
MPSRNLVYEALVLRSRESPGGDRILTLMTAEAGLVDAFVFGGPKSKLRSLASPYAAGRAFVYLDPVKDFRKLADFEVREHFPGLREDLGKLWAAGLLAELLMKTSGGGGDFPLVLELALGCLGCMDRAEVADYAILLFLWRYVALIGLGPDPGSCARCGSGLPAGASYSAKAEGFLCPACARRAAEAAAAQAYGGGPLLPEAGEGPEPLGGRLIALSAGALRWLERSEGLGFAEALRAGVDPASLSALKALAFALARRAAEAPLASFSLGAGLS